jgi:hypothetical protein
LPRFTVQASPHLFIEVSTMEALEEIAQQTKFNMGHRHGSKGTKIGHRGGITDNLIRASLHVEREKKQRQPRPTGTKTPPPPNPAPAPLASANIGRAFSDYQTLVETCRARADELALSRLEIDRLAGLPTGYAGKLLGKSEHRKTKKKFGPISLEAMLGALGLKIILIEDEAATARTLALRTPVDRAQQRFGNVSRISLRALPPPDNRETHAEEEATAA